MPAVISRAFSLSVDVPVEVVVAAGGPDGPLRCQLALWVPAADLINHDDSPNASFAVDWERRAFVVSRRSRYTPLEPGAGSAFSFGRMGSSRAAQQIGSARGHGTRIARRDACRAVTGKNGLLHVVPLRRERAAYFLR